MIFTRRALVLAGTVLVAAIGWCSNFALAAMPQFRGVYSPPSAGTAGFQLPMPTGVLAGDILLAVIETANEAITVSGGTETWTEIPDSPQGTGTAGASNSPRITVFWARASQAGPTGPTTSDSGNRQQGTIIAFSGCVTTGNPWDVTSGGVESTSDTSGAITGDTTTVANTLVVALLGVGLPDATNAANFSSWANADLTAVTERLDYSSTSGVGGGIGIATGEKATAGAYGDTTVTLANAAAKAFITIALVGADTTLNPFWKRYIEEE